MHFEWKTSARQILAADIDNQGNIVVTLTSAHGESKAVPAIVLSHLQHWWKAEQILMSISAMANTQRGELKNSVVRRNSGSPQGLELRYDSLRRHTQNLHGMISIRDVALSRALNAADKALFGREEGANNVSGVIMAPEAMLKENKFAPATH